MINFRQKDFSILEDTIKGAGIGAAIGSTVSSGLKFKQFKKTKAGKLNDTKPLTIIGGGILIGAALGALAGSLKVIESKISRSNINKRILSDVLANLEKSGYQSDVDFTVNPKIANSIGTKVCLVVSRSSDILKLLINTVSDPKLKSITKEIIKTLPTSSMTNETRGDRFNELNISTFSSNNNDSIFISGVVEKFIQRGFPVQLVEVG